MLDILTVAQAAEHYGCSPSLVRAACAAGALPGRKLGKTWLIERKHLRRWAPTGKTGRPRRDAPRQP